MSLNHEDDKIVTEKSVVKVFVLTDINNSCPVRNAPPQVKKRLETP